MTTDPTPTLTVEHLRAASRVLKPAHTTACPSGPIEACECPALGRVKEAALLIARMVTDAEQRAYSRGYHDGRVAGYDAGRAEVSAAVGRLVQVYDGVHGGHVGTPGSRERIYYGVTHDLRAVLADPAAAVARIKAEALREAADSWDRNEGPGIPTAAWLRARADEVTP